MERIDALPPEIELAQLVQRCAAREVEAFRQLYDKTSAIVYARLLRMLRRRSVADLALQEVYVRVWERAAAYEAGRGRPLAWLVTIARYCAIDFMRRERLSLDADEVPAATFERGPDAGATPNHSSDAFDGLPPETRLCLDLAYADGYSHEEIAQLTLSPLADIKRDMRRCLLALRDRPARAGKAA
jgi:RNA polymerase sigma-70 factor (ECF subfamily)